MGFTRVKREAEEQLKAEADGQTKHFELAGMTVAELKQFVAGKGIELQADGALEGRVG